MSETAESRTTVTTPSDVEISVSRILNAPLPLVWEAWTSPEHRPHWMLGPEGWTIPVCEMDLRPGGKWHIVWSGPDGAAMDMRGSYTEVTSPTRLVSTESWGAEWPETINVLTLEELDGKTRLTETMHYPNKEARDNALTCDMSDGMEVSFQNLETYIASLA